jgi:glutathione peroxidase-family protein
MKDMREINVSDLKKVQWNYEKFLVDKDGVPVRRFVVNYCTL